jgi:hypothetical protein
MEWESNGCNSSVRCKKLRSELEMHRVKVHPPSAPDEAMAFKDGDDVRGDTSHIRSPTPGGPSPQPVIRKGWVDIDGCAPCMHARLAGVSDRSTGIGSSYRINVFLILRWQPIQFTGDYRQLSINAVDRRDAENVCPRPRQPDDRHKRRRHLSRPAVPVHLVKKCSVSHPSGIMLRRRQKRRACPGTAIAIDQGWSRS